MRFIIVNFFIWCIEKLMNNAVEVGPAHVVVMDDEMYDDFCEFRDACFIMYENEEELLDDFPNAKPAPPTLQ